MVKYQDGSLDLTFAALAAATRRDILARLAVAEASVTVLAAPYNMSLPAVSKHLGVLEAAGLIRRWKAGRTHLCCLTPAPIGLAADWIGDYRRFWDAAFDRLETHLHNSEENNNG